MNIRIHPHARERMIECGATEEEIVSAIEDGEEFHVKCGRTGFRRDFTFEQEWRGRFY